jgi:hypothetical protein
MDGKNKNISLGTGFVMGGTSLDYAFGLVNDTNSLHRVSFSFRFGTPKTAPLDDERNRVIFDPQSKDFWKKTEQSK